MVLINSDSSCDFSFNFNPSNETNNQLNVVVDDYFLLNLLTTLVQVKDNSLFEFVYLFDVWVNQIDFN